MPICCLWKKNSLYLTLLAINQMNTQMNGSSSAQFCYILNRFSQISLIFLPISECDEIILDFCINIKNKS